MPAIFLMYHELELPGRPLANSEPGYVRYVVTQAQFREQMQFLKAKGYEGASVSRALQFGATKRVAITVDDGCETDLLVAAPCLRELGFSATFYITAGWLGRPGYLSPGQLKELGEMFEIGCHSLTHAYLTDLDDRGLQAETLQAKSRLEQALGRPIHHFSCPGGRYDARVANAARTAGYRTVATSSVHANSAETDPFALGRIAVQRHVALHEFGEICSGAALPVIQRRSSLHRAAQKLLGNNLYDAVRGLALWGRG